MTTATAEQIGEFMSCVKALEDFVMANKLPTTESGERSIAKAIIDMEIYVRTLIFDPPVRGSGIRTSMNAELGVLMDEKIITAISMSRGNQPSETTWYKLIRESKAIQEISSVVDAKQHRQWDKKMEMQSNEFDRLQGRP